MNTEQQAAAFSTSPNVLCIAGAGSGKTTTLVEAVAAKCRESGASAVLCITFTVAGAVEMKTRLAALPPEKGGPIKNLGFVGTLHAFLLKQLRQHHKLLGLPKALAVVDDDARDALLLQVMQDMGCKATAKMMTE